MPRDCGGEPGPVPPPPRFSHSVCFPDFPGPNMRRDEFAPKKGQAFSFLPCKTCLNDRSLHSIKRPDPEKKRKKKTALAPRNLGSPLCRPSPQPDVWTLVSSWGSRRNGRRQPSVEAAACHPRRNQTRGGLSQDLQVGNSNKGRV